MKTDLSVEGLRALYTKHNCQPGHHGWYGEPTDPSKAGCACPFGIVLYDLGVSSVEDIKAMAFITVAKTLGEECGEIKAFTSGYDRGPGAICHPFDYLGAGYTPEQAAGCCATFEQGQRVRAAFYAEAVDLEAIAEEEDDEDLDWT